MEKIQEILNKGLKEYEKKHKIVSYKKKTVARFHKQKGLDRLIRVYSKVKDYYHLVIVGDGELKNNLYDLLKLLYLTNKKIDNMNDILPVYNNYSNDDEYFNLLFTYIISLKEENAKLIEKLENK